MTRRTRVLRWTLGVLAMAAASVVAIVLVAPRITASQPGCAADYPSYPTTAELEASADLILRGTVTSVVEDPDDPLSTAIATIEVTATAKGTAPAGSTVEISYTSCATGDWTEPEAGGEYVVLLDDSADREEDWLPTPVNLDQGFYGVTDGHAVAGPGNPVALDPATLQRLGLS
ncbi:hypothetical protein [Cellulomonas xylanilytica]|uniref:hypothetical protein n=1 Tax=Cellulomonas xylanilytica TaxID=233583 RepID=UPI0011BF53D3|nr:hypothetical protein [Cellulomonas xylanilytica]